VIVKMVALTAVAATVVCNVVDRVGLALFLGHLALTALLSDQGAGISHIQEIGDI
jgi:hypothetical protein